MLPPANVIGEFGPIAKQFNLDKNGPWGRDFTIKMAWMPDRKRAFFCGANHGSPHRLNDAWEYDLPSNTWALLYDPDYNDAIRLKNLPAAGVTLQDGILVTAKGGPVHVAHTWWGLTYDPQLKAALWMCVWPGYGMPEKLVQDDKAGRLPFQRLVRSGANAAARHTRRRSQTSTAGHRLSHRRALGPPLPDTFAVSRPPTWTSLSFKGHRRYWATGPERIPPQATVRYGQDRSAAR